VVSNAVVAGNVVAGYVVADSAVAVEHLNGFPNEWRTFFSDPIGFRRLQKKHLLIVIHIKSNVPVNKSPSSI
jgi:hypothetical protein